MCKGIINKIFNPYNSYVASKLPPICHPLNPRTQWTKSCWNCVSAIAFPGAITAMPIAPPLPLMLSLTLVIPLSLPRIGKVAAPNLVFPLMFGSFSAASLFLLVVFSDLMVLLFLLSLSISSRLLPLAFLPLRFCLFLLLPLALFSLRLLFLLLTLHFFLLALPLDLCFLVALLAPVLLSQCSFRRAGGLRV